MTLIQLRYFVAIVDAGFNVSVAATRVHATQPGISKQLKQLEQELGFLLFERKAKSLMRVTPAGAAVLDHARVVLAETACIRARSAGYRDQRRYLLRIAATPTQCRHVLNSPLAALNRRHASADITLRVSDNDEACALVERGEVDMAIVSSARPPVSGLVAIPLFRWHRAILVPGTHALATRRNAPSLAELAQFELITYDYSARAESAFSRRFAEHGLRPRFAACARDSCLIKNYVRAGLGVGVVAEMAVDAEADRDLVAISTRGLFDPCTSWAVFPTSRMPWDIALDLVLELAPQHDARILRRAFALGHSPQWPATRFWRSTRRNGPAPLVAPSNAVARAG